ncbi:MAG: Fe(3+) ABC transporter substrate-binding protein [Chelatococcus sp.]|jgi:iron(III) transport system substrate-binding protein|uniref:Fe(3+) ABC transporter substrate-binding protein n=1 Tax=unclassified Chelatococcus TaxID=2638111 RepID=UPI001BCCB354|nr:MULTISPECIES: Fe(3+) ABC transporter substrate-binding protein [unclassified Chelatococcus]CAH1669854.1 Iron uptake protein A2 [Hyphomicrobiales bacterium]MBS7739281.1 Fe(3+) ABC transporter substrate-binding protein [Chelatococcus sp. HY11]MBX3539067.1 Fe(3+) ABC transporter substrate-binding protein [Chelatococcus sp.]MBX3546560.1 Fe(3+) ABC transporter substrate-binding protein [Chelatococcus sp.]MCO5076186.1 Fe(3+) ABC transporter substrate-binding protein [Chelatococcus sp.]
MSINRIARIACLAGIAGLSAGFSTAASAAEEVTLYTTREPGLIKPLLDAFTEKSGIQVKTLFVKDGLAERVATEGANSPADVLMTVDFGNLIDLVDKGVVQPVKSDALNAAIPANLRDADGRWFALSTRARVLYASKDRTDLKSFTYEDLADPKWKGKVCIRAGQHPYNTALIANMIAKDGAAKTEEWLKGVKANLARKAGGGDRDVARDILGGICDVGLANSYYVGLMRSGAGGPDQVKWGEAINVILPTFEKGGTHVNVSGAAVAKNAPHAANAVKLIEFLASDDAQELYAKANFEYPVKAGVKADPIIASFGELKIDPAELTAIGKNRKAASELADKVGFDN